METLIALIPALIPTISATITSALTGLIKKIPVIDNMSDDYHKAVVRLIAAVLSFGSVVAMYMLHGTEIDQSAIQVLVDAVLSFLGATGIFFFLKKKDGSISTQ